MICYNLACYCISLSRPDESLVWLKRALAIDEATVMKNAIDDCDLKPLLTRL
jgi:hypothetical protein